MSAPDVLTVSEVAAYLRCGRNAAYQLIARGDLWGVKVGRSIRVPRQSLERFLHVTNNETGADVTPAPVPTEKGHSNDRIPA